VREKPDADDPPTRDNGESSEAGLDVGEGLGSDPAALEELLEYLKRERGFDFTGYKRASLGRRIGRRMASVGVPDYATYLEYLEVHPGEFHELFNTILINVTSFFRDEIAWEYVRAEIVPAILARRPSPEPIRVWSAGCASGAEAYSVAMAFAEELSEDDFRARVKIYATDVDDEALAAARHATYAERELAPVPQELVARYFENVDGGFTFRPDLRRRVIFGRHDLVQDAPISRIDLLVCRNTLMYFNAETQARVLGNFTFALRDGGFLFLGKSEVLLSRTKSFVPVDLRRRVFAKSPLVPAREHPVVSLELAPPPDPSDTDLLTRGFDAAPIAQIIVDRSGSLVRANAQARALFGLADADIRQPLQNLELSYRPLELRSRIDQSYAEHRPVLARDVEWRISGEQRLIDAQVVPLLAETGDVVGVSVTFADVTRYRRLQDELQVSRHELETAYEELQSTVEELETTNEELQSTNEELETTNEELQSTNEELETMNEELQSANEELETINDEMRQRGIDVARLNLFLESILTSLSSGVVVLDPELRVQVWNSRARELWGLRGDEVAGQHFLTLDIGLPVEELRPLLRAVVAGSEHENVVVRARDRRGRLLDCHVTGMPLRSDGSDPRGVIVLFDVHEPVDGEADA
jgi:two-component system CheB/CheR fusion protein